MSKKIAVVEDDVAIQQMYKLRFELDGFIVNCAGDGQAGLKLIEDFKPDLLLLDLRMPIMNGDEMLEQIRASKNGYELRVIILTNISRAEIPQKLRFLNVDRYIVKAHYTPGQVVKIVNEVLNRAA